MVSSQMSRTPHEVWNSSRNYKNRQYSTYVPYCGRLCVIPEGSHGWIRQSSAHIKAIFLILSFVCFFTQLIEFPCRLPTCAISHGPWRRPLARKEIRFSFYEPKLSSRRCTESPAMMSGSKLKGSLQKLRPFNFQGRHRAASSWAPQLSTSSKLLLIGTILGVRSEVGTWPINFQASQHLTDGNPTQES